MKVINAELITLYKKARLIGFNAQKALAVAKDVYSFNGNIKKNIIA